MMGKITYEIAAAEAAIADVIRMMEADQVRKMVRDAEAHARSLGINLDEGEGTGPFPATIPVRLELADHLVDALIAIGDTAGAEEIQEAVKGAKDSPS